MTAGAAKKAPAKNGAGRPCLGETAMGTHTVRMTDKQWAKLERIGGPAWLRGKIDAAKEPEAK